MISSKNWYIRFSNKNRDFLFNDISLINLVENSAFLSGIGKSAVFLRQSAVEILIVKVGLLNSTLFDFSKISNDWIDIPGRCPYVLITRMYQYICYVVGIEPDCNSGKLWLDEKWSKKWKIFMRTSQNDNYLARGLRYRGFDYTVL
jgi:hypothetical protein